MIVGSPRETFPGEARVAMTPASARELQKLGHSCMIESGAGDAAGYPDAVYQEAGVDIATSAEDLYRKADFIVKVRPPNDDEAARISTDKTLVSFFYPAEQEDLLKRLADNGAKTLAMDMVPRISRAQKMDALSSMANIAGYRSVIEAGNNFGRFFTGQVTAAGKVQLPRCLSLVLVSRA